MRNCMLLAREILQKSQCYIVLYFCIFLHFNFFLRNCSVAIICALKITTMSSFWSFNPNNSKLIVIWNFILFPLFPLFLNFEHFRKLSLLSICILKVITTQNLTFKVISSFVCNAAI